MNKKRKRTVVLDNADKRPHSYFMTMRDQIIAVSDAYGRLTGVGRKRVSTIVLNRGSKLDGIVAGGDLNTGTFERAMQWFSDNWPPGADWPDGVLRPSTTMEAAE